LFVVSPHPLLTDIILKVKHMVKNSTLIFVAVVSGWTWGKGGGTPKEKKGLKIRHDEGNLDFMG